MANDHVLWTLLLLALHAHAQPVSDFDRENYARGHAEEPYVNRRFADGYRTDFVDVQDFHSWLTITPHCYDTQPGGLGRQSRMEHRSVADKTASGLYTAGPVEEYDHPSNRTGPTVSR